jgi:hypothetical protein
MTDQTAELRAEIAHLKLQIEQQHERFGIEVEKRTAALQRARSEAEASSAAKSDAPLHPMAAEHVQPPAPRLQAYPAQELEAYRQAQSRWILEYGWIDRGQGLVHVPIERAMELVLEEGLPERSR